MDREKALQRAEEHIFSTGLNDSAAQLGRSNMKYGLAKIHWVQEALDLAPNATFVAAPDLTVTRNANRWRSGLGYGGRLVWGDGQQEFVVLDVKPNCCGMLVGGLDSLLSADTLIDRVRALEDEVISIDGVPVKWDFGVSNHFIDLFRVQPLVVGGDLRCHPYGRPRGVRPYSPFAFIMHSSGGELRGETSLGDGLYWDKSEALRRKAEVLKTPFGPLRILTGPEARSYYAFCCRADAFARKRRLLAAERLFGSYTLINNDAHQRLVSMNEMLLGSYPVQADAIFPLTLRADLPAYLIRGKPNLTDETIEKLGFGQRARRLGVYERLTSANIVPHGGGYAFPQIRDVLSIVEAGGERYFEVGLSNDGIRQLITHTRDIPYTYRGQEVVQRVVELDMGALIARLDPIYVLKL